MNGIVGAEEARLSHDEQVAVAANIVPMLFDLLEDLIGRSGEHCAGLDRAFDRGLLGAEGADHVVRAPRQLHVHRHWHITRRI